MIEKQLQLECIELQKKIDEMEKAYPNLQRDIEFLEKAYPETMKEIRTKRILSAYPDLNKGWITATGNNLIDLSEWS